MALGTNYARLGPKQIKIVAVQMHMVGKVNYNDGPHYSHPSSSVALVTKWLYKFKVAKCLEICHKLLRTRSHSGFKKVLIHYKFYK